MIVVTARSHCSAGCTSLEARLGKHRGLYVNAFLTLSSCNTSHEDDAFGKQPASRTISAAQCTYYMLDALSARLQACFFGSIHRHRQQPFHASVANNRRH